MVAGALIGALGVALPLLRSSSEQGFNWHALAGGVAVLCAGALLSWAVSQAIGRREAVEEMARRLDAVARTIGHQSGQIIATIKRAAVLEISLETFLNLVHEETRAIQVAVNEIGVITGQGYEDAGAPETISRIDRTVAKITQAQELVSGGKPLTDEDRKKLQSALADATQSLTQTASEAKALPAEMFRTVACPDCGNSVNIKFRPGRDRARAICLRCFASLEVSAPEMTVRFDGKLQVIEGVKIVGKRGKRPVVECQACGTAIAAQVVHGGTAYVICSEHKVIMPVPMESFDEWAKSVKQEEG